MRPLLLASLVAFDGKRVRGCDGTLLRLLLCQVRVKSTRMFSADSPPISRRCGFQAFILFCMGRHSVVTLLCGMQAGKKHIDLKNIACAGIRWANDCHPCPTANNFMEHLPGESAGGDLN